MKNEPVRTDWNPVKMIGPRSPDKLFSRLLLEPTAAPAVRWQNAIGGFLNSVRGAGSNVPGIGIDPEEAFIASLIP